MKLLLENWRKYLTEEEEYSITPEQNQALKGLYILISRLYEHLNQWIEEKGYDTSSNRLKSQIRKEYEPPPHIIKKGRDLYLDVSEYKQVFPNLADDFYVAFRPDVDGNAELGRLRGQVEYMAIGTKNFSNPTQIKQSIHHELQHIIDEGSDASESGVEGKINYLSNAGEVNAHAKEAAYYFHKTFPEEDQFDIEKIKEGVKNNFTNYYNFATKASDIAQRRNLDPSYEQKMKKAGEQFIKYATYYLPLFKQRER